MKIVLKLSLVHSTVVMYVHEEMGELYALSLLMYTCISWKLNLAVNGADD